EGLGGQGERDQQGGPATSGPAGTRKRPVTALEMTEAAMPGTSRAPSAPTGWPRLSRIEGHSRPRVEPGRATLRYARQASGKAGTVKAFLVKGRSPCRESRAARDDGLVLASARAAVPGHLNS